MAGQGEEDVVEGRPAKTDVVDADAGFIEVADDLDQHGRAAMSRHRQPPGVLVDERLFAGGAGQDLDRALEAVAGVDDNLDPLAADL